MKLIVTVFFFFLTIFKIEAAEESSKKTICLNMIVKNESPVIERCLASVKDLIDYWVIVDTGSTDGTQKVIKNYLKGIPGELHEKPWVDFAHNRNEALQFAKDKADYILFIDADEVLEWGTLDKKSLDKGGYLASVRMPWHLDIKLHRTLLVKNSLDWRWLGIIHERVVCPYDVEAQILEKTVIRADYLDGHRCQDPRKYHKDAEVIEKALLKEPDNAEYVYYLGQSYYNAQEYDKAIAAYAKRATMKGWDQHVFWSLYMVAMLQNIQHLPQETVIDSFCKAYQNRPTRAEPLYRIASIYLEKGNSILAYLIAKYALTFTTPNDSVYVENWIYDFGLEALMADSARLLGKTDECKESLAKLLTKENLPANLRQQITTDLADPKLLSSAQGEYVNKDK